MPSGNSTPLSSHPEDRGPKQFHPRTPDRTYKKWLPLGPSQRRGGPQCSANSTKRIRTTRGIAEDFPLCPILFPGKPNDGRLPSTGDVGLMKLTGPAPRGDISRHPIGTDLRGRRIAGRPENGHDRPLGRRKIGAILPGARSTLLLVGRPEETPTEPERRASGSCRSTQSAVAKSGQVDRKSLSGPET